MSTEIIIMIISPAQGGVFAPLALKLVQSVLPSSDADYPLVEFMYTT